MVQEVSLGNGRIHIRCNARIEPFLGMFERKSLATGDRLGDAHVRVARPAIDIDMGLRPLLLEQRQQQPGIIAARQGGLNIVAECGNRATDEDPHRRQTAIGMGFQIARLDVGQGNGRPWNNRRRIAQSHHRAGGQHANLVNRGLVAEHIAVVDILVGRLHRERRPIDGEQHRLQRRGQHAKCRVVVKLKHTEFVTEEPRRTLFGECHTVMTGSPGAPGSRVRSGPPDQVHERGSAEPPAMEERANHHRLTINRAVDRGCVSGQGPAHKAFINAKLNGYDAGEPDAFEMPPRGQQHATRSIGPVRAM